MIQFCSLYLWWFLALPSKHLWDLCGKMESTKKKRRKTLKRKHFFASFDGRLTVTATCFWCQIDEWRKTEPPSKGPWLGFCFPHTGREASSKEHCVWVVRFCATRAAWGVSTLSIVCLRRSEKDKEVKLHYRFLCLGSGFRWRLCLRSWKAGKAKGKD